MQSLRVPLRKIAPALGLVSLFAAVGCGTGGSPVVIVPTGNFSNASLNGSYVYELRGQALTSSFSFSTVPYREVGVLTADGAGNVGKTTAGSDDVSGSTTPAAVTGTYSISKDGTGFIQMNSQLGQITLAVTMVSNSTIYLTEADAGVVAVGQAELQDSSVVGTTPSGNFVFRIHQEASQTGAPASQVGQVSLSAGGGNGVMDQNVGGASTLNAAVTVTVNAPGALGRGTGTLTETASSATTNFIYYIVNSGKLDLLISDTNAVGSGSAEAQSGAVANGLSGSYVFGSEGDDVNYLNGFAAVGQFTTNAGTVSGREDVAQDGNITSNSAFSACYNAASANGRVALTNGSGAPCSASITAVYWMVSPSRAFFLDLNSSAVDDGTADLQTTTSFSSSTLNGQYAVAMAGVDLTVQQLGYPSQMLSRVGTMQFNGSSKLLVSEEVNTSVTSSGASSAALSGNYSVPSSGANGRITGGASNGNGSGIDLVIYGVSGSKAYVLQTDPGLVTSGILEQQQQ